MPSEDYNYYSTRASEERERAATASHPSITNIHLELAEKYERLAREAEIQSTMRPGWGGSQLA